MTIGTDQIQSLVRARRLLLLANQAAKPRPEAKMEGPSFKEIMEGSDVPPAPGVELKTAGPQKSSYSQTKEGSTFDKLT